jgi:hypothetical protein
MIHNFLHNVNYFLHNVHYIFYNVITFIFFYSYDANAYKNINYDSKKIKVIVEELRNISINYKPIINIECECNFFYNKANIALILKGEYFPLFLIGFEFDYHIQRKYISFPHFKSGIGKEIKMKNNYSFIANTIYYINNQEYYMQKEIWITKKIYEKLNIGIGIAYQDNDNENKNSINLGLKLNFVL